MDEMDENEMDDAEERAAWHTSAQTAGDLKKELGELDGLIGLAERTAKTKPDTKLDRLVSEISGIGKDKLLIFSEYRDTLNYLEENIAKMRREDGSEYDMCRIDGTMSMTDREVAQEAFRTHSQIMLATDAAREGIKPPVLPPHDQLRPAVDPPYHWSSEWAGYTGTARSMTW